VIERSVGGDASRPRPEAACRVKACVRAIDAPEGFDGEVLGCSRISNDVNDPTVDLTLMPAKQRLEGVEVAVTSPAVRRMAVPALASPLYICLRREGDEGYRICYRSSQNSGLSANQ